MGIGNVGASPDAILRGNVRLGTFLSSPSTATVDTVTAMRPGLTTPLLYANSRECLWYGVSYATSNCTTGALYSLRGWVGNTAIRIQRSSQAFAFDPQGSFYWFDTIANVIRKMAVGSRDVTSFYGSGAQSTTNGTGTAGTIEGAQGMAFDAAGNMYVAVHATFKGVKVISPAGVMTTLAGNTTGGADADGTGAAATFNGATALGLDPSGNVYVINQSNFRIRKVTPAGVVTTFAGSGTSAYTDGTGIGASFNGPNKIQYDASTSTLVVTDNAKIRRVTLAGVVTTLTGTGAAGSTDGAVASAQTSGAYGIVALPNGDIWFSSTGDGYIRKISGGQVTTMGGQLVQAANNTMDGWAAAGRSVSAYATWVLAPGNTQVVGAEYNGTRYQLMDLANYGYIGNYLGDTSAGSTFYWTGPAAEIPVVEIAVPISTGTAYAPMGYLPFAAPIRIPANTRVAVNFSCETAIVGSITCRGVFGYPSSLE